MTSSRDTTAAVSLLLRNIVFAIVVPGAGHFWSVDPVDEPGSFGAYAGPKIMRFLDVAL